MKTLKKICNGVELSIDWIGKISSFLVLATLGVILIEVVLRRLFHNPQIWTMDMICMTFGCYIILICAFGFQKKAFVAVDVLYARLPKLGQQILHTITYFIFAVPFLFVLVPESWTFFYRSFSTGEKSYSVWAAPVWPVKLCLFIGLVMLCLQLLCELAKHLIWIGEYVCSGKKEPSENYMKEGL